MLIIKQYFIQKLFSINFSSTLYYLTKYGSMGVNCCTFWRQFEGILNAMKKIQFTELVLKWKLINYFSLNPISQHFNPCKIYKS